MNDHTDFGTDCQLPHEPDDERAILAAAAVDPATAPIIAELVDPEDFYATDHQTIMGAIFALMLDGKATDMGSILESLQEAGQLGNGLGAYLGRLMDHPAAVDIPAAAGRIKKAAARRHIIAKTSQLMQDAQDDDGIEDIRRKAAEAFSSIEIALDESAGGWKAPTRPPAMRTMRITTEEIGAATLTPRCIVRDYLYCDVATMAAPGGTGKTTIALREMACIILGRPLYGLEVVTPGWCLFVTAEDCREILIARLREIMKAMALTADEQQIVMDQLLIWDVTGEQMRLIRAEDGNVVLTPLADDIIRAYREDPPILVVFDPVVSFGAGESFVNDNEQGLVTAARRIMRGLGCCVRLIAHTGKGNAREKSLDQYTSRGGSALSDGARMVAVLQNWNPGDNLRLPPGCVADPDSTITILARPKLSYAAPQPLIWIRRTGWAFEHFLEISISDEERETAELDQVERFLESEVKCSTFHNKTSLVAAHKKMNLARDNARDAIEKLMAKGRIVEVDLPADQQITKRKTYLTTPALFRGIQKNGVSQEGKDDEKNHPK